MNKVRRSAWQVPFMAIALMGSSLYAFGLAGCGDDDDDVAGQGGASGGSGKAGKAGQSAASGSGGSGGSGGVAGAGGGGGGGSAGASGASGASGGAGAGGAGAGGAGAGGAGQGGGGAAGAALTFCSKQGPVAFCADFDGVDPFGIGGRGWDEVSNVAGLAIASNQSVSTPNGLRVASSLGVERPSLMKTALFEGGAPIVSATLDYDLFVESLPKAEGAGVGLVDFQFAAADDYGFRLVLEANADGTAKDLRLEHNFSDGMTVVRPPLASLPPQAWTHVHCEAFFTPGKPNRAALRVYFGRAGTPAIDESFDAPFGFAGLARVRVLPFHFTGGAPNPGALSYGLYFDNVVVATVGVPPELGGPGGARP